MAMPHLVFKRKCEERLKGLNGKKKIEEIHKLFEEMPKYKSGPYGELRHWLKEEMENARTKSKITARDSFAVKKLGDIQAVFVGLPSSGKSSLISAMSSAQLKTAAYDFTTLKPEAVTIGIQGIQVQLIDLPGLIENASQGKGLGKRIIASIRQADLIVLVHDCSLPWSKSLQIIKELQNAGIELSKENCLIAVNKIDLPECSEAKIEIDYKIIRVSALNKTNLNELKNAIFEKTNFIRVYSRFESEKPVILKKASTVKDFCQKIHKDLIKEAKHAKLWGKNAKFPGQKISLNYQLNDEDIIEIVK